MILNLKLVKIDSKYCDYLRQFDDRVMYNMNEKELRPFVGILFKVNQFEYFAPLSSPKAKHLKMKNTIDFYKIDGGILGAVNFNNMIPVLRDNYELIDLDNDKIVISEKKYQKLLKEQLSWLNENYIQIMNKSYKLYNLYNEGRLSKNIMDRCCNYKLLEEKCVLYEDSCVEVSV